MQAQKGPQKMDEVKQPSRQDGLFGSQPFWNVFQRGLENMMLMACRLLWEVRPIPQSITNGELKISVKDSVKDSYNNWLVG